MVVAIFFYGLGALDLVQFVGAAALHLVVGWVYLILAPLTLPRHPSVAARRGNPFAPPKQSS